MHSRDQHACQGQTVEILDKIEHELRLSTAPAVGQYFPIAHVGCDNDAARIKGAHLGEPIRVFQRACADDYSFRPVVQTTLNHIPRADSAADLYLDVGSSEYCLDLGSVVSVTANPIEIDNVQMMETILT